MSFLIDTFTRYALQIQMDDYVESRLGIQPERFILKQFYSDSVLVTLYRSGSMAITNSQRQTLKFFTSPAKYWHRTRKIRRRIKNETHWLHQFGEYVEDRPEMIMKYYLERKKKG